MLGHADSWQDISARAPAVPSMAPRQSLDSRMTGLPRTSSTFTRPLPTKEEEFEDVGLQDDQKPKKRGFLSRFTDSNDDATDARPASSHGFHFGGRKRGQSGQGAELGDMRGSTDGRPGDQP